MERVTPPPGQYADFCADRPQACAMTGPPVAAMTPRRWETLRAINRAVNAEVHLVPDLEWLGKEEVWSLPRAGCGDCEDYALEKRERLARRGWPRAAMTMAIVHHKTRLFPHAVLLVRTTAGTFVLDNLHDAVTCWDAIPFNFEARERPDGRWTRFDQRAWTHAPIIPFAPQHDAR